MCKEIPPFSFSADERKPMAHFVVSKFFVEDSTFAGKSAQSAERFNRGLLFALPHRLQLSFGFDEPWIDLERGFELLLRLGVAAALGEHLP